MSESTDTYPDGTYPDPVIEVDPECDKSPVAPEGRYTSAEHGTRILSMGPRSFDTKRGPVTYLDINVIVPNVPEVGTVFARTEAFGRYNTQTTKNAGSLAKQFVAQLNMAGRRGSEAEGMPVTVDLDIRSYVAKEDQLTQEERDAGKEARLTEQNSIKNIMVE